MKIEIKVIIIFMFFEIDNLCVFNFRFSSISALFRSASVSVAICIAGFVSLNAAYEYARLLWLYFFVKFYDMLYCLSSM